MSEQSDGVVQPEPGASAPPEEANPYSGGQTPVASGPKRVRTRHFQNAKANGIPITGLTSYDQMTAGIFDEAGIDFLLVGDSAGNTVFGYDTTLPQNLGLYRRLMALLYVEAQRRDCRLHLSSGAGTFKRGRGGVPHQEYSAIYSGHLGRAQSTAIKTFAAFMDRAVPWALARAEPAKAGEPANATTAPN